MSELKSYTKAGLVFGGAFLLLGAEFKDAALPVAGGAGLGLLLDTMNCIIKCNSSTAPQNASTQETKITPP